MNLTINQVAKALALPRTTVERWVRQGRIPIQKSGDTYVFNQSALEKWAGTHNMLFSPPAPECAQSCEPEFAGLLTAMKKGRIFYDIEGQDVESVLKSAVDRIDSMDDAARKELYERLLEREQLTSTGIGKGIAIPHPRSPMTDHIEKSVVYICFLKHPIHFNAVDGQPVFILFILLSPTPKCHLQLLSRLSFCVRDADFMTFLKSIPKPDAFFDRVAEAEARLDGKGMF